MAHAAQGTRNGLALEAQREEIRDHQDGHGHGDTSCGRQREDDTPMSSTPLHNSICIVCEKKHISRDLK